MTLMFSFITSFLMGFYSEIAHELGGLSGALLISSGATVIVVLSLIAWGIPLHLLFKSRGIFSPYLYFFSGCFPGFFIIFVFHLFGNDTFSEKLQQSLILGMFGGVAAVVFWYFARVKNA